MKNLRLVLALCGAAALFGVGTASAFETQGEGDPINGQSLLAEQYRNYLADTIPGDGPQ